MGRRNPGGREVSTGGPGRALALLRSQSALVALVALVAAASVAYDKFLLPLNLSNILRQVSMIGLVSIGMTFAILTGGIDLSVGSIAALAAVIAANFSDRILLVPLLLPLVVGAAAGCLNGLIITRMRLPPFIVTLAMMLGVRGVAFIVSKGEPVRAQRLSQAFTQIARGSVLGFPNFALIFIAVLLLAIGILRYTRFGRSVYAVGGNEEAARMMGLKVDQVKIGVYLLSGLLSGAAGMLLASRLGSGQPYAASGWELTAIAGVVIGGTLLSGGVGHVLGTFYGVLILGIIANAINLQGTLPYWYANLVTAILLLVVILIQARVYRRD